MKTPLMAPKPFPIQISDYDNLWNQIACERAKPHLNPNLKADEEKIKKLSRELREVSRRDGVGWWAESG